MDAALALEAYESHREPLLRRLLALTRDRALAEDVLQESYLRLLGELHAGRPPRNPQAWLYRVGYNLVVSRARRQRVACRWAERNVERHAVQSVEEHFLLREAGRELHAVLAKLDERDRRALWMAAQGFSGAEISSVVGRSEAAVRTRMCRARARLRLELAGRVREIVAA